MASEDVVVMIFEIFRDTLEYLWPVIGVMAGIVFIISWIMSVLFGSGRRTFGA